MEIFDSEGWRRYKMIDEARHRRIDEELRELQERVEQLESRLASLQSRGRND